MRWGARPSLARVAMVVGDRLRDHGIEAVLTGGACAAIYSGGAHASVDVDLILRGSVSQAALDEAMATMGFSRNRDRYLHPDIPFYVEFPRGPLAIGGDLAIRPVVHRSHRSSALALSATDSCRDRLAAFYHWNDRQSLAVAVAIAVRHRVVMERIRDWSLAEGAAERFEEFLGAVRRARIARRAR